MPEAARARVAEFIGELVGVRFPDDESPALWAARTDARLMREQMLRAWSDLVRAECAQHPVVLVLDDLQWADAPTIRTVSMALGSFRICPSSCWASRAPRCRGPSPSSGKSRARSTSG